MKFLRKNKSKIMAIVVVLIMAAFLVPQLLQRWSHPGIKPTAAIGHYGVKSSITNQDKEAARSELSMLQFMQADQFLRSRPAGGFMQQSPDVPSLLLSHLLFPNPQFSPLIAQEIKRIARQGGLHATDGKIDEFFEQASQEKPELYWMLLRGEAREAGIAVSREQAGSLLKSMIPQFTQDQVKPEQLIAAVIKQYNVEQDTALQVFADLLGVVQYMEMVTKNESITIDQLKYEVLAQAQTLDANAIIISADKLVDKAPQPTDAEVTELFNKYKNSAPMNFTSENPYGIGFKQPARVQIEYAMLNMSDVQKLIPQPTPEQTEEFYLKNLSQFKYQEPSDPNDPNSKQIEKTRSFAEVASDIAEQLQRNRVNERAQNILSEVREIVDSNLITLDLDNAPLAEVTKLAGSYESAAKAVAARHNVRILTGKTGLVTASDIEQNQILSRFNIPGQGQTQTSLSQIVFAIKDLDDIKLGPFAPVRQPRLFETVGPITDYMNQFSSIVRVIDAKKSQVPATLELTIAKKLPVDSNGTIAESNEVFVLKKVVIESAKKLAALPVARQAAEALVKAVPEKGWDVALADLNKQFGSSKDPNSQTFTVQPLSGIRRISGQSVIMLKRQASEDPGRESWAGMYQQQKELIDKLYDIIPDNQAIATNLPQIVEQKAGMTFYILKTLGQTLVTKEQFDKLKPQLAIMNDLVTSQSLGLDMLMPNHIIKRLNFKWDQENMNRPVQQPEAPMDEVI